MIPAARPARHTPGPVIPPSSMCNKSRRAVSPLPDHFDGRERSPRYPRQDVVVPCSLPAISSRPSSAVLSAVRRRVTPLVACACLASISSSQSGPSVCFAAVFSSICPIRSCSAAATQSDASRQTTLARSISSLRWATSVNSVSSSMSRVSSPISLIPHRPL